MDRRPDSPSPLHLIAATLAVVVFSRSATGIYPAVGIVDGSELTTAGRLIYPVVGVAAAAVVMARRGVGGFRNPVWLLVLVCALSTIWSADRERSAFQAIVLTSAVVAGCAVSSVWRGRTGYVLGLVLCLTASLNLAADVFGVARSITEGGLMEHKNLLGSLAAIGAVSLAASPGERGPAWRITRVASMVASVIVVVYCESRTSLLVLVVGIAAIAVARIVQRGMKTMLVPLFAAALLGGLIVVRAMGGVDGLLASGGKDSTFTGRTEIWHFALELWRLRPIQGWGFFAPWGNVRLVPSMETGFEQFNVRSSHNGFVEMLVGVGLIGAASFVIVVARCVRSVVRSRSVWATAVIAMVLAGSMFESILPGPVNTLSFFVLASAMNLSETTRSERQPGTSPPLTASDTIGHRRPAPIVGS